MMRMRAGLWVVAILGLVVLVAFSQQEKQKEVMIDLDAYQELLASRVCDIGDLQDWFFEQLDAWLPLLPPAPDVALRQDCPGVLVFDWKDFPPKFVEGLSWRNVNGVPVASISIFVDPVTCETVFLSEDVEIYALPPADFDRFGFLKTFRPQLYSGRYSESTVAWHESLYDPVRLIIDVKLLPSDPSYLEFYLYAEAQIEEASAALAESEEGGLELLMMEGDPTELAIEKIALASGGIDLLIGYPAEYIDSVWSIFSYDAPACALEEGGEGVMSFDPPPDGEIPPPPDGYCPCVTDFTNRFQGLENVWELIESTLVLTGETHTTWHDSRPLGEDAYGNPIHRFYALGSILDEDEDGLSSAYEIFCSKTDNLNWDTDGDGISDGEEILIDGTDPLDKYSVRPPDMLRTEGAQIVDESGNPVILKSVNIGGWLAWEQWLLGFEPRTATNAVGQIKTDDATEADMLEWMMVNAGESIILMATNYSTASGTTASNWNSGLNPYPASYMGSFTSSSYLGFANVDFGEQGISNLAIGIAVPDSNAGKQIVVRLDSPTGTNVIGTLTVRGCGPDWRYWVAFTEQHVSLNRSLSGTQTVYFTGQGGDNEGIGNLFRFRFYREPTNTMALVETFQNSYFVTNDLDRLKSLGYNCIRVPFYYRLLEDDLNPYVYKQSGWTRLDRVVEECAKRRMWVLLDLHGAPGGVNPWHSAGEAIPFRNRLWKNEHYIDRTEKLWTAIAGRYKGNPAVVGFDLINEPFPPLESETFSFRSQAFSNDVLPLLSRLYSAVRATNTEHIVFMEGNHLYNGMWADIGWWPKPDTMTWSKVCYQFHNYENSVWHPVDLSFRTQKRSCDNMIRALCKMREEYQVPIFVGEFGPGSEQSTEYWTRQMNAYDLSWCHWNFRSWGWDFADKPEQGKTAFGLDFRSKATTNDAAKPMTASLNDLQYQMSLYSHENYSENPSMTAIMQRHAMNPTLAKEETCDFFLHTFSADYSTQLSDDWPWNKVSAIGQASKFWIWDKKARLYLDSGALFMRCRSRIEADARFLINDSQGCAASVKIESIFVSSSGAGNEAGVSLVMVRDEIDQPLATYPTEGVIARLAYDHNGGMAELQLFAKTNAVAGTLGTNLYASVAPAATFAPGAALELHVNSVNAYVRYNGTNYPSVVHGIALDRWPNNAVALVQVERLEAGNAMYVELDDLLVQRESAGIDTFFAEDFSTYPEGTELGGVPDYASYPPDVWSTHLHSHSYIGQNSLVWVPSSYNYGGTWYNPRRSYQQDVRFALTATNVVEMQMSCSNFTNGIMKLAFMPEYVPEEVFNSYNGTVLYTEVKYDEEGTLVFDLVRQWGTGDENRQWVFAAGGIGYDPTKLITFQIGSTTARVYYGSTCLISRGHGADATTVFSRGVYPHFEYQNTETSDNAVAELGNIRIRQIPGFQTP